MYNYTAHNAYVLALGIFMRPKNYIYTKVP